MLTMKPNKMFVLLFILGTNLRLIYGAALDQNVGYCAAPTVADNFDIEWAHDHAIDKWYITTGNNEARTHIYEILQGKNLTEESTPDYSDMCSKFTIDVDNTDGNFKGQYFGFGDKSADWSCNFDNDQFQCKYENNPDHTYVQEGQAYLSYFDGKADHNVFVAVLCFDNGDSGWFAASLTKTITKEEKEAVDTHLKSIGFDPNNSVDLHTSKCA